MVRIERFEDVESWKKGRELCKMVYDMTNSGEFRRDYGLRDQIRRASVSVISNIAEGFESQNDRTFIRYLYIAKGSSGEVRAQAYVALDQGYISEEEFKSLYTLVTQISRLISGFIKYLEKRS
jgi:four helix bundle protein